MKHENINPLLDRLYEKRESLDHGIELIDKKIEAKLTVIDNEKNKVWLPADDAIIETAEIEKNVFEKEKLSLQVFRANIELQILDKEFNRDNHLGVFHSQNEISRHEIAKENIIIITRMKIKQAADAGIITKDEIAYYNDSIEPKEANVPDLPLENNMTKSGKRKQLTNEEKAKLYVSSYIDYFKEDAHKMKRDIPLKELEKRTDLSKSMWQKWLKGKNAKINKALIYKIVSDKIKSKYNYSDSVRDKLEELLSDINSTL